MAHRLTVGRIVHYYDERGRGPIAALCVESDLVGHEYGAEAILELHQSPNVVTGAGVVVRVPQEAGALGNGASWRWPPVE